MNDPIDSVGRQVNAQLFKEAARRRGEALHGGRYRFTGIIKRRPCGEWKPVLRTPAPPTSEGEK